MPAFENGWHGNPAVKISQSGISSTGTVVISLPSISPRLSLNTAWASLSKSFAPTLVYPAASKPLSIPPQPENNDTSLGEYVFCSIEFSVSTHNFSFVESSPFNSTTESKSHWSVSHILSKVDILTFLSFPIFAIAFVDNFAIVLRSSLDIPFSKRVCHKGL